MATAVDLKVPEKVEGDPVTFIVIKGETDGKVIKFKPLDPGLSIFPASELKDQKTAVVIAKEAGEYRLAAVTGKGDEVSEISIIKVVIGKPKPKPDPVNPVDPVDPADPQLVKLLQEAYDKEPAGEKEALRLLKALYSGAAEDQFLASVGSWKSLHEAMGKAAQTLKVSGRLKGVQKECSAHLQRKKVPAPTSTATLDAAGRKLASQEFKALAAAMGALK